MRIIAIERDLPTPAHPNLQEILHEEAASVWDLSQRGIIRDIWYTIADRRAVALLECANAAEARRHLAALPLVQHGLIEFTVLELRNYDGFARLFAADTEVGPPRPKHAEPAEY